MRTFFINATVANSDSL